MQATPIVETIILAGFILGELDAAVIREILGPIMAETALKKAGEMTG